MILNENNLEQEMNVLFKETNDWIKVFDILQQKINEIPDQYSSMKSNFYSIFNYVLLKNRIDINSYESMIKYFYKYSSVENIGDMFRRFFNYKDSDITIAGYVKLDKYNNSHSKWDNMACLFFNMENNKLILDKDMLPYLLVMLNNITEKKISALYEGMFSSFCRMLVTNNFEELIPLIKLAKTNKSFEMREAKEYGSFLETILRHIGSYSYETNKEELIKIRNILEKEYPNFLELFLLNLLKNDDFSKEKKIKYEPGLFRFALECELDIIPGINQRYLELLKECQREEECNKSSNYYIRYDSLIANFDTSLEISLGEKNFHLDLEQIDMNADLKENWLLLKCLEIKMKKDQVIKMSDKLILYINNILNKDDDKSFELEKELMLKYINYLILDSKIEVKNVKTTTHKI